LSIHWWNSFHGFSLWLCDKHTVTWCLKARIVELEKHHGDVHC
jgi:hypothetical protein